MKVQDEKHFFKAKYNFLTLYFTNKVENNNNNYYVLGILKGVFHPAGTFYDAT